MGLQPPQTEGAPINMAQPPSKKAARPQLPLELIDLIHAEALTLILTQDLHNPSLRNFIKSTLRLASISPVFFHRTLLAVEDNCFWWHNGWDNIEVNFVGSNLLGSSDNLGAASKSGGFSRMIDCEECESFVMSSKESTERSRLLAEFWGRMMPLWCLLNNNRGMVRRTSERHRYQEVKREEGRTWRVTR